MHKNEEQTLDIKINPPEIKSRILVELREMEKNYGNTIINIISQWNFGGITSNVNNFWCYFFYVFIQKTSISGLG